MSADCHVSDSAVVGTFPGRDITRGTGLLGRTVITFANVVGRMLCIHPCLLLCKIVDFCKVYWSPRFVCLSVCLFVCLFVCLSVCSRCTGHTTGPVFLKFSQLMYSVPSTLKKFFGKIWVKVKVKATTFVKIT